jgi:collagenase-like PrtC family protease
MAGLEFSVPYNNDPETLTEIFNLKKLGDNSIREVYLSGPQEIFGSERVRPNLKFNEFVSLMDKIHEESLRVNLTLHTTCEGENWYTPQAIEKKIKYLQQLHKEHGLDTVTVANPIYIMAIMQDIPELEICASVLADIDCTQRANLYKEFGASVITPDANINHNLKLLAEIKATGAKLKLMVNEGCLYKCPFRKFHFNEISHHSLISQPETGVFFANCQEVLRSDRSQVFKSGWIRPEDVRKYSDITGYFKIVGRARPKDFIIRTIKAYMMESWEGDLFDILDSSLSLFGINDMAYLNNKNLDKQQYFETITACDKSCAGCGYCSKLADEELKLHIPTPAKLAETGLSGMVEELQKTGDMTDPDKTRIFFH